MKKIISFMMAASMMFTTASVFAYTDAELLAGMAPTSANRGNFENRADGYTGDDSKRFAIAVVGDSEGTDLMYLQPENSAITATVKSEAAAEGNVGLLLENSSGTGYLNIDYWESGLTSGNIITEFDMRFSDFDTDVRFAMRQASSYSHTNEILVIDGGNVKVATTQGVESTFLKPQQWYHFKIVYEENGYANGVWNKGTAVVQIREGVGTNGSLVLDTISLTYRNANTATKLDHEFEIKLVTPADKTSKVYLDNLTVSGAQTLAHQTAKFVTADEDKKIASSIADLQGKTVDAALTFKDTTLSDAAYLFTACYDGDGRLLDVAMSAKAIDASDGVRNTARVSVPANATSMKMFTINPTSLSPVLDFVDIK